MSSLEANGVVIVGAGVCGIRVASLLSARGVPCVLLDARTQAGGRASSVVSEPAGGALFDVGATWHWPDKQPRMVRLVSELGLSTFPQYAQGDVWVERFRLERAERYRASSAAATTALRIDGGLRSLVEGMLRKLPPGVLRLGRRVLSIDCSDARTARVEVHAGEPLRCRGVVLALPPRAILSGLALRPAPSERLRLRLHQIPTWLAAQAKAVAVYETPFWREAGHSGLVSSLVGPLQEIHDASPRSGVGALFGFFGVSALARQRLGEAELRALVLAQLTRLFGERAANPLDFIYKDWATEAHIASAPDLEPPTEYLSPRRPSDDAEELWNGQLVFAGSEMAAEHRGYLEGALESAERAAARAAELTAR